MARWSATCSSCCSRSAPRKAASRAELIARSDELEALAAGVRKDLKILSGWRYEQFGRDALDLVEGRLAFAIENGKLKMSRVVEEEIGRCVGWCCCPRLLLPPARVHRRRLNRPKSRFMAKHPATPAMQPGPTQFIGQPATSETGAAILRATNAAALRWAPPGVYDDDGIQPQPRDRAPGLDLQDH